MKMEHSIMFSILIATILLFSQIAYSATQQEIVNSINKQIEPDLSAKAIQAINATVKGNWSSIDIFAIAFNPNSTNVTNLVISQFGNTSFTPIIVNGSVVNDNDTNVPLPPPQPTCPPNQVYNATSQKCEDITLPPEDNTMRLGVIADIDDNSGLTNQAKLMKSHNVEVIIIAGDYNYHDGNAALKRITDAGFTKEQIKIAVGNHDSCSDIKGYLGTTSCIQDFYLGDKNIQLITMDGKETGMTCGTDSQYTKVKDLVSQNEHKISIVVIHEPFVTVKSDHPPNGGFDCYNSLFQSEGVNLVLQGHNHNYQYIQIGEIGYGIFGTGTHDSGSNMYPCSSSTFNSMSVKCITGINGFTQIDINSVSKHIEGKFISNADAVIDEWSLN